MVSTSPLQALQEQSISKGRHIYCMIITVLVVDSRAVVAIVQDLPKWEVGAGGWVVPQTSCDVVR